jgi:hypothetical protein
VKNIQEVLEIALVDWNGQLDMDQHKRTPAKEEAKEKAKKPNERNGQVAA